MNHPYDMPPRPPRPRPSRDQMGGRLTGRLSGKPPAVRLLPVLIVAALVMVGFKVQVIVRDVAGTPSLLSFVMSQSTALAQAAPNTAPTETMPAAAPPAEGAAEAPAAGAEGMADASADGTMAGGGPPLPVNFDPSNLTKAEIDTLQRLAERRELIDRREREVAAKEGLLKAAESRIDGKVAQLQELEKNIQGLLQQYDAQKQEEIDQLVRIYSVMKPKDAARIFDTLEMPILVGVVQKMKEAKIAPIMAAMDSAKATALTEELTAQKDIGAGQGG